VVYLLQAPEKGSYHIMVAAVTVGAGGSLLDVASRTRLPESVLDLWRRIEMCKPNI
jgi:hypothetical protein